MKLEDSYVFYYLSRELKHYVKPIPNTFSNYSNDESYCCFLSFISEWETPTWPPSIQMGVTAGIFLASILLNEMRYLVYIRYLWYIHILRSDQERLRKMQHKVLW